LASKRDTRFTYHLPNAVLAFEGGIQDRGGNVYVYRATSAKERWAKQAILKIGGPLLGVAALSVGTETLLICLTEEDLVLVQNV